MDKLRKVELQKCNNDFRSVASEINNGLSDTNFELCEDNYVGTFDIRNNGVISDLWFCKNLRSMKSNKIKITEKRLKLIRQSGDKILLIVLESPHIDEFNKLICSITPAPALGITGG